MENVCLLLSKVAEDKKKYKNHESNKSVGGVNVQFSRFLVSYFLPESVTGNDVMAQECSITDCWAA